MKSFRSPSARSASKPRNHPTQSRLKLPFRATTSATRRRFWLVCTANRGTAISSRLPNVTLSSQQTPLNPGEAPLHPSLEILDLPWRPPQKPDESARGLGPMASSPARWPRIGDTHRPDHHSYARYPVKTAEHKYLMT